MQIIETLQKLNSSLISISYNLGYQDKETTIENLLWSAQLNMYYDALATSVFKTEMIDSGAVPFLPAGKIMLNINSHTTTHHIPTQI